MDTFQRGFGGLWWKNGEDISRFEEMLPALYVSDLGGSQTTHAIGYCLRSMGAAALIYPSARCNAETVIEDGMLRSWYGFNLVDFRGSGASDQEAGSQVKQECFEDQAAWNVPMWESMRLEIADISDDRDLARRFKGSWRVRGVEEAHQRHFEAGGVLGGREGGEWEEVGVDTTGEFIRGLRAALNDRSE